MDVPKEPTSPSRRKTGKPGPADLYDIPSNVLAVADDLYDVPPGAIKPPPILSASSDLYDVPSNVLAATTSTSPDNLYDVPSRVHSAALAGGDDVCLVPQSIGGNRTIMTVPGAADLYDKPSGSDLTSTGVEQMMARCAELQERAKR